MRKIAKTVLVMVMAFTMFIPISSLTLQAADEGSLDLLLEVCADPQSNVAEIDSKYLKVTNWDESHFYNCEDGNQITYKSIADSDTAINETVFNTLKSGEKQAFLKDYISVMNAKVASDEEDAKTATSVDSNMCTEETANQVLLMIQDKTGMGSQLLATLMADTKPDYATAGRIYAPFSGVVGTILGVIAILIMAALGLTMALDIAYITIPAFQLFCGGSDNNGGQNGQGGSGNKIGGFVSMEAKKAVEAAGGGGGNQGQTGSEDKQALGVYFKYRWKGLVLLGICLLYLVQGQIYTLVAAIIDLMSGFLGF